MSTVFYRLGEDGYPLSSITQFQPGTEDAYLENGYVCLSEQPTPHHYWTGEAWVLSSEQVLALQRTEKGKEIDSACRSTILGGFTSYALGVEYRYPAKLTDQSNLSGSILASMLPETPTDWVTPFWCADAQGVWAFRTHTITQIQQVGHDAKQAILLAMSKNEQLQTQIALASSIEELNQISW